MGFFGSIFGGGKSSKPSASSWSYAKTFNSGGAWTGGSNVRFGAASIAERFAGCAGGDVEFAVEDLDLNHRNDIWKEAYQQAWEECFVEAMEENPFDPVIDEEEVQEKAEEYAWDMACEMMEQYFSGSLYIPSDYLDVAWYDWSDHNM